MKEWLEREIERQRLDQPVVSPRFCTINELVDELCAPYLQPDDEIHSVCQLYSLFRERTGRDIGLDVFYGWGRQLLTDFSNTDASDVDADTLFANTAAARELEEMRLDDETLNRLRELMKEQQPPAFEESVRKSLNDLWLALPDIYHSFRAKQQEQGIAYSGARLKFVVDHFDDLILPQLKDRQFAFIGFNYLLGKERALMLRLKEAGKAIFFWDHVPDFRTNKNAYKYTAANSKLLGQALPASAPASGEASGSARSNRSAPIRIIATSSQNAQAQFVHQWLQERAHATGRIGIVIADETMLEPVIFSLPKEVSGRVNITKGYPLRNTKVFAFIVAYLSDPAHDKQEGETYSAVLTRLTEQIGTMMEAERSPEENTWQQALIQESYYQAQVVINRFCRLIDEGTLADIRQLATLRNLLRRHLETVLLPFHGDPITQIQVIGVLETRLLDFDHLLVLNVEEGVVPKTPADNSFIPFYLRKCYHMPTGGESAEVYAYNFFRLLHRAEDATLLFSNATEGDTKKGMSRFIMQLLTSGEFPVERLQLVEGGLVSTDELTLVDPSRLPLWRQGAQRLSPSAINAYIDCPMRFYLQHVLHLSSSEESGTVMPANDLGSLIHATLQVIYRTIGVPCEAGLQVRADRLQAFVADQRAMDNAIEEGFKLVNATYAKHHNGEEGHYLPSEHQAETLVARSHVTNVLRTDMATAQNGLVIIAMEKWFDFTLPLTIDGQAYHVTIGGLVDRLDRVGAQGLRIIDYKTGRYDEKRMETKLLDSLFVSGSDKGYFLQTLLYCMALDESRQYDTDTIMPGLFFTGKKGCNPQLSVNGSALTDYRLVREAFVPLLQDKVSEIVTATSFPKCSESNCSALCPFHLLCGRKVKEF